MPENTAIIEVEKLTRVYKGMDVPAVNALSFKINRNDIFGLLGPNGAGKTTTLSILCGYSRPDSGKIVVDGMEMGKESEDIKKIIGVVPQEIALYPTLSAKENLRFFGKMYGLRGKQLTEKINHYLHLFGLEKNASRLTGTYSGGMKRRVNLIAGILHDPKILFLDEPTVGIDVQSRTVILEFLHQMNKNGTTIIYTSHLMEEAENLCRQIAIIDHGKIIAKGNPETLIKASEKCHNLEGIFLQLTGRTLRD
ncbi:MAG TPA: ABC transporter ATP-binding protein [Bacteroidales bacterium]|nr:ABC transporter ATP-binding protein [Bacteroidales bacterium]